MGTAIVEFNGICVYVDASNLGGNTPVVGGRFVLPNGNPLAIQGNPNLNTLDIVPHYAQLAIPVNATIVGPAASLFFQVVMNDQLWLYLNLNTVGMQEGVPNSPPLTGLTGATVQWVNADGPFPVAPTALACLPHLSNSLGTIAEVGPVATTPDANVVSAYFDVLVGGMQGFLSGNGQGFAQMIVNTLGPPQLLILPWDGTEPTLVTLPENGIAVIINEPFAGGQDALVDFMLSFVVTNNQFPPSNRLNTDSSCQAGTPYGPQEAGPGCSSSGIP